MSLEKEIFAFKMIVFGLFGGMIRYLTTAVRLIKDPKKLSVTLLLINGAVGLFSGTMTYFIIKILYPDAIEEAFFLAMGIGSFGGEWVLWQILKRAAFNLQLMTDDEVKKLEELRGKE